MSTHPPTRLLYRWLLRQKRPSGFTLTELLIAIIIVAIVLSGLLALVVELLQIDRREATLDRVQQDMQRAMDYLQDDVREAVYVYTNPQTIATRLGSNLPAGTPVLAFWRLDPLEQGLPTCSTYTAGSANRDRCEVLRLRQATYTLVVYVQRSNDGNANWPGQSRIIRYELSKYTAAGFPNIRGGYRDPTTPGDPLASFENWQPNGTPAGFSAVLVDFVDSPTVTLNKPPLSDTGAPCRSLGANYVVSPSTASTTANTSFFACILNPDPDGDPNTTDRANQDLYVFLRGNALSGTPGQVTSFSRASALPTLETQVMVRGIVDKRTN